MVVIHYTAMISCDAAARILCDPDNGGTPVSAHYLVSEQGAVMALVPETMRAWHAGAGRWGAVTDVNSHSIGIELANSGSTPFAAAQMRALETLLGGIMARWDIGPERVIGHSDMAPGRKVDPGTRFDWRRLARGGLSVWSDATADGNADAQTVDATLQALGYTADVAPDVRLAAFRLRFRPGWVGAPDATDLARARDLCTRFPVDRPGVWA